jgi:hypothetical protein
VLLKTTVKLSARCQLAFKLAMLAGLFLHSFRIIGEIIERNGVNEMLQAIFVDLNQRFC